MTASTTSFTRLRCDARGCDREYPEDKPLFGGQQFARKRAAAAGWVYRLVGDLCPEHVDCSIDDLNPTGRLAG